MSAQVNSWDMPDCKCPYCGKVYDAASGLYSAPPKPDDFTLCYRCLKYLVFTQDMRVRKPTPEEEKEIAESRECKVALATVIVMKRKQATQN